MSAPVLVVGKNGQLAQALNFASPDPLEFRGAADHDFFDVAATARLIEDQGFQTLINTAAYTAVDQAEQDQEAAYSLNRGLPIALTQACLKTDARLIHVSTDYVFDGTKDGPYVPTDPTSPINVYGASKLAGEQAVLSSGAQAHIVRTSWVVSRFGRNFLQTMVGLMQDREGLGIVDDQLGTPTLAPSLALNLLELSSKDKLPTAPISHFSNGQVMTWFGLASQIRSVLADRGLSLAHLRAIPTSAYLTPAARGKNTALLPTFEQTTSEEAFADLLKTEVISLL